MFSSRASRIIKLALKNGTNEKCDETGFNDEYGDDLRSRSAQKNFLEGQEIVEVANADIDEPKINTNLDPLVSFKMNKFLSANIDLDKMSKSSIISNEIIKPAVSTNNQNEDCSACSNSLKIVMNEELSSVMNEAKDDDKENSIPVISEDNFDELLQPVELTGNPGKSELLATKNTGFNVQKDDQYLDSKAPSDEFETNEEKTNGSITYAQLLPVSMDEAINVHHKIAEARYVDLDNSIPITIETLNDTAEEYTSVEKTANETFQPPLFTRSPTTSKSTWEEDASSGSSFHPDGDETDSSSENDNKSVIIGISNKLIVSSTTFCENGNLQEVSQQSDKYQMDRIIKNSEGNVDRSKKKALLDKRIWDKKDVCIFCEETVTNLTRHMSRNHSGELEVAKYLSLPKGSSERKIIADQLRKKGNFFSNVGTVQPLKPVRRPNEYSDLSLPKDYLPCKFCYGYYRKRYLKRHLKICKLREHEIQPRRRNIQAEAQTLQLTFTSEDEKLVAEVFPRMAPDDISLAAKSDPLIRAFGTRYIKCHKEKHLIAVVSNKMRELARFLIEMRKIEKCLTLQDTLKPTYFDSIIKATKKISGYDLQTDTFKAPSLVLKIGTALKQCCDIAEYLLLKNSVLLRKTENTEIAIKEVRTVEKLIDKQWCYELSTNASKEIYQKTWNKPALLPLTSDIKLFRDHLVCVQNKSMSALKENPKDVISFRNLEESVLAQLILLNRKRAGEVQRIFLKTYLNPCPDTPQEEIELSLSPVERQLTKAFKRIVIRGKRGRGVPILFTPKLQKAISLLIALREPFCGKTNEYLFALPNTEHSCIRASDVMRKLSIASGAKIPSAITSTKLRKQVATVAQLLNFTEGDVEQLANFMGHSKDIHKTFYRLPENVFQVAKVSKFLLMMEKGNADQYRGKNLDQIDISVNTLLSDESDNNGSDISSSDEEIEKESELKSEQLITGEIKNEKSTVSDQTVSREDKKNETVKEKKGGRKTNGSSKEVHKKKFVRVEWTNEQRATTIKYFQKHILLRKPPKKAECEEFQQKFQDLMTGLTWQKIKTFVYNMYKKN